MPRNASNEEVKNESCFIEFQHSCSPNDLIHSVKRRLEGLPKDFSDPHLEPEFENDGDHPYFVGFRLDYARPVTDEEKKAELEFKKYQAEQYRQRKLREFARLRQEFADVPEEEIAQLQEDEGPQPAVAMPRLVLNNRPRWGIMPDAVAAPARFADNPEPPVPPAPEVNLQRGQQLMYNRPMQAWLIVNEMGEAVARA